MMIFASPRVKLPALSIAVGAESHQPSGQVKNLGVTLYVNLTMEAHITRVCQVSYFQLKIIRTVHNVLTLVRAFLTSRLDYYNSVLVTIPDTAI